MRILNNTLSVLKTREMLPVAVWANYPENQVALIDKEGSF